MVIARYVLPLVAVALALGAGACAPRQPDAPNYYEGTYGAPSADVLHEEDKEGRPTQWEWVFASRAEAQE